MKLERFAADQDVRLVPDALAAVEPDRHVAITAYSGRLAYDALLVCVGARPVRALPGAITFRGGRDAAAVRAALDAVQPGEAATIAFAVPFGAFWTLPLYELAILAAARLREPRGAGAGRDDLARGRAAGGLRRRRPRPRWRTLLDARGIEFVAPRARDRGRRRRARARRRPADPGASASITLPDLVGRRVPGLPQDAEGFIAVDDHGRVPGADGVYAAGDVTTFPLKQGGLATQQADAAAEAMLAALGLPIVPRPFEPVLKGVLYTDREPAYLRASVAAGAGLRAAPVLDVVAAEQDRRAPPGALSRDPRRSAARARGAARARRHRGQHRRAARRACRLQRARSERGTARLIRLRRYGSRCGEATDGARGAWA